jgi:hypothetical protein
MENLIIKEFQVLPFAMPLTFTLEITERCDRIVSLRGRNMKYHASYCLVKSVSDHRKCFTEGHTQCKDILCGNE